jgi:hypothetical protein
MEAAEDEAVIGKQVTIGDIEGVQRCGEAFPEVLAYR